MPYAQMFGGASTMEADELALLALMQGLPADAPGARLRQCGPAAVRRGRRRARARSSCGVPSARAAAGSSCSCSPRRSCSAGWPPPWGSRPPTSRWGQWGLPFLEANTGQIPFWYDPRLSPATVLYACALTGARRRNRRRAPRAQGDARPRGAPAGRHGRRRRPAVRRRVDGGDRRAGLRLTVAFPAVVLVELKEFKPAPVVRRRVRGRRVPRGEPRDRYPAGGCGRGRGQRDPGGPPRAVRYGARGAPPARRGPSRGVVGVTFVDKLPLTNYFDHPHRPSTIRRPPPRRPARRAHRWGAAAAALHDDRVRGSVVFRRAGGARSSRGGDSRPPTSPRARGWRSWTRASWTRCCRGGTRSGQRVRIADGGTLPDGPGRRLASPGTRSWAS